MQNDISPLQKIGCFLILCYQKVLSPVIGHQCRFYPTCSEYTKQAILIHGFFRGCYLGFKRILKCHPFHPGGIDLVPDKTFFEKSNNTKHQK